MLKSVNHYREFTLNHPSRAPPSLFTLPEETEIIHLGTGGILMMNIAMSSFVTRSFEEVMSMQLGGERKTMQLGEGKMIMQLGEWIEMPQGEKGSSGVERIIKGNDTGMLKMMLEVIWYRIG